ncbi:hypothetical protein MEO40_08090 [Dolichospermum sp. ST_sed1]|nr:hypothetical protein [Dolichospermum sp. ST_sed1]MDD1424245.1 hypothetical protein [Dolichospermum sp. ST_sed9]MDD1429757.1 hypothetical protein [Dolichospermum sp. ST_sed6]MDD1440555.1 hypothetical protein [Dolichospermum sp. ST_sed3]MDD1446111.1 hypothetical protein [Dolichospermum sp. ST_sed8]MDD1454729.1 hypothetical protein [Dolichospermum sp. ST_sed7]MDD1459615.1 hypothetical protein [Dolichospermum sp. ST_sed2]MDD1465616.1 hypothetical protein [Dolichospermum sp. ST_sed5]MDD147080
MNQKVNQKTVCFIQANQSSYSETFIRAHIDHLPARVRHLHHNTTLSKRGIQRVAEKFNWKVISQSWFQELQQI